MTNGGLEESDHGENNVGGRVTLAVAVLQRERLAADAVQAVLVRLTLHLLAELVAQLQVHGAELLLALHQWNPVINI